MKRWFFLLGLALLVVGDVTAGKKGSLEGLDIPCDDGQGKQYSGQLISIQPAAREIMVQSGDSKKEFRLASNCKLVTTEKSAAELTDLKLGMRVTVKYFVTKLETVIACSVTQKAEVKKK
jgi:hypothetical protein